MKRFFLHLAIGSILCAAPLSAGVPVYIQRPPAITYPGLSTSQLQAFSARGVIILQDYGSFAVAEAPDDFDADAAGAETALIVVIDRRARRLDLAGFDIDATSLVGSAPSDAPPSLLFSDYPTTIGLYLVQFHGPILAPWLETLRSAGVRPIQYVNANAYIVAAPSGLTALRFKLLAPPVRYVGVLQPAYKVSQALRAKLTAGALKVRLILDAGQDLTDIVSTMKVWDADVTLTPVRQGERQVALSADSARRTLLAKRSEVLWIEEYVAPSPSDERANQIGAGNFENGAPKTSPRYLDWLSSVGLSNLAAEPPEIVDIQDTGTQTSSSATGCISGSSVFGGHPDLNNGSNLARLEYACPTPTCGSQNIRDGFFHGTFVAGLIAGNPAQSGGSGLTDNTGLFYWGMGVAPTVHFGFTKLFTDTGGTCGSPDIVAIASQAYSAGARYQNDSWNDINPLDTTYSVNARTYDQIVRDAYVQDVSRPLTVVFSAGNIPGADTRVQSPATAKNVLTVGSSALPRGLTYGGALGGSCDNNLSIKDVPPFSTRATRDVNRFKPDLVAPGRTLTSAFSSYSTQYECSGGPPPVPLAGTGGNYYPATGTSFSAPLVTASAVLVRRKLWNTYGFWAAPSMIKAALIGAADTVQGGWDYAAGGSLGWEPGVAQGWGRLDLARVFDSTPKVWGNEDPARVFTTSGSYQNFTMSIADPSKPLIIVLAWSDAAGPLGATSPLVNQLNLWVMQGQYTYCDGQYTGQYSTASTGCWLPDFSNNVKVVRIAPNSFSGQFTIQVQGAAISAHAVPGVSGLSQDYSVFVYNGQ